MPGFVKLYETILDSSVWSEPHATRIVWITLLAMAGPDGRVEASVGGLARRAHVTRKEAEKALAVLLAPDNDDKSKVNEGRRIEECPRGWIIVNHRHYRDLRSDKQARAAERVRRFREKTRVTGNDVTPGNGAKRTEAEAEEEAEEEASKQAGVLLVVEAAERERGARPMVARSATPTKLAASEVTLPRAFEAYAAELGLTPKEFSDAKADWVAKTKPSTGDHLGSLLCRFIEAKAARKRENGSSNGAVHDGTHEVDRALKEAGIET